MIWIAFIITLIIAAVLVIALLQARSTERTWIRAREMLKAGKL